MRTCKKCGCYLPDGRFACLACGYDESVYIPYPLETRSSSVNPMDMVYAPPDMTTISGSEGNIVHDKAGNKCYISDGDNMIEVYIV